MASYNEIPVSTLARLVGTADCPAIVDVRDDIEFGHDMRLIPGACRYLHNKLCNQPELSAGKTVVVYCQSGGAISQGSAALLRSKGFQAEVLEGGYLAWRKAALPAVNVARMPPLNDHGQTVWVTRHRPKIDRVACPWLIRRFVDPKAQFLFVPASQVIDVAERVNAVPFDIEDVFWSHRGENCTFDTMIEEFGIGNDALACLARIVRAADTNKHDLAPEAAGLLAASLGLSRMYRDDLAQLEAGMMLYDAFYRWARDAMNEGHDWPVTKGKTRI